MGVLNLSSCSVSRSTECNQFADLADEEERNDNILHIYVNEYVFIVVHKFLAREKLYSCEYLSVLLKSPGTERESFLPLLITSFLEQSEVAFREAGTFCCFPPCKTTPFPLLDICVWDKMLSNSICSSLHNTADYILLCGDV